MTEEEIIQHLADNNDLGYNLFKASEECQELGLVLTQKMLKADKVDDQEIIDEIGDVELRLRILRKLYPEDKINERVQYKLSKYEEYITGKLYTNI